MKSIRKALALAVALTLTLALTLTASAVNIHINDPNTSASYVGYKLLNLTTSDKEGGGYNYAYSVNTKYQAILTAVTGADDDAGIISYIEALSADADVRDFADEIYRAIATLVPALDNDKVIPAGQDVVVEEGYWLIAEVSTALASGEAYSLVLLGTAGGEDFKVAPKKDAPTVDKLVQENSNNVWGESANYEIGDSVPFMLIGTLPNNLTSYNTYFYTFHDLLSEGLTYNGDAKVYLVDSAFTPGEALSTEITSSFTITSNEQSLTVGCADILPISNIGAGKKIVVVYTATLNEDAEIASEANPNEVYLEYSNAPYGTGNGVTPKVEVEVYTYEFKIYKYTGDLGEGVEPGTDTGLPGAGFTLRYENENGGAIAFAALGNGAYRVAVDGDSDTVTEVTSPDDGKITISGLDAGTYYLEETTVPAGYNEAGPWTIVIADENIDGTHTLSVDSELTTIVNIQNNAGTILPETGGMGTRIFTIVGIVLMAGAAVVLAARKKTSTKD